MKIENSFVVSAPPAVSWPILTDIERIAPCVPDATLHEATGHDDNAWSARLSASGREGRNRGTANADVRFWLTPEAGGTRVHIEPELQLAGSIAQYGRGAGVIQTVAESLIDQFTRCLEENIVAAPNQTPAAPKAEALSAFALFIDVVRRTIARWCRAD